MLLARPGRGRRRGRRPGCAAARWPMPRRRAAAPPDAGGRRRRPQHRRRLRPPPRPAGALAPVGAGAPGLARRARLRASRPPAARSRRFGARRAWARRAGVAVRRGGGSGRAGRGRTPPRWRPRRGLTARRAPPASRRAPAVAGAPLACWRRRPAACCAGSTVVAAGRCGRRAAPRAWRAGRARGSARAGGRGRRGRPRGLGRAAPARRRREASAETRCLELGGALGRAAGPFAQALDLARLREVEQRQHGEPEDGREPGVGAVLLDLAARPRGRRAEPS